MTGRTGRHQQQGDAVDADWAQVTDGNGSAAVRAPVETAAPARHRPVVSAANLRLAVVAVMIVVVGAGAGCIVSLLLPTQYAARAELQYNLSQAMPNELLREDRRLTTQLVLLRSRVVLGPVASEQRDDTRGPRQERLRRRRRRQRDHRGRGAGPDATSVPRCC